METKSPYTFKTIGNGNVEVYQNDQRISTGTADAAARYGYDTNITANQNKAASMGVMIPGAGGGMIDPPTTLSNTNIIENVKPDLTKRIEDFSKTGSYTDTEGTKRYADETPVPDAPQKTTLYNPVTGATQELDNTNDKSTIKSLQDQGWEVGQEDVYSKSTRELIDSMKNSLDASTKRTIDNIEQQFNVRKQQLAEINRRQEEGVKQSLNIGGSSRYAQVSSQGVVSTQETAGLMAISELDAQEKDLINQAKAAQDSGNFQLLEKQLNMAESKRQEKQKAAADLSQKIAEQNKKIKDQMIQASRDGAVSDLISQGVTDPSQLLNVLNYDEKGNMIGDFTAEEIGKTIKNLAPTKDVQDLGTDGNMLKFAKDQGWLPKDATIFDYWKKEAAAKKSPAADKVGNGTGTPQDFAQFSKESIAMSMVPVALRNSDSEKTYLLSGIRQGLKEGKSPYEIADTLMGYMITDKSAFSEGMRKYVSLASGDDKNMAPELARLINGGQYDLAISKIENVIYDKIQKQNPDTFVSEADATYVASKVNSIKKLLGSGWNDEVGAFTGSFSSWLSKKFGYGDANKIKAQLTSLTADLISKRAGSTLTKEEWDRLVAGSVPSFNESPKTWVTKLNELKSNPLTRLNSQRSSFELPTISEKELFDRKLRVPAYSSQSAIDSADDPLEVTGSANNPLGLPGI